MAATRNTNLKVVLFNRYTLCISDDMLLIFCAQLRLPVQEPLLSRDLHVPADDADGVRRVGDRHSAHAPELFQLGRPHVRYEGGGVRLPPVDQLLAHRLPRDGQQRAADPVHRHLLRSHLSSRDGIAAIAVRLRLRRRHGAAGVVPKAGGAPRQVATRHLRCVRRVLVAARRHLRVRHRQPLPEGRLRARDAAGAREQRHQQRRLRRDERRLPRRLPLPRLLLL